MSIQVKTPPAVEPVTLTEAKAHLRVTASVDDTYISTLIAVARQRAETYLRRSIVTQTLEQTADSFPAEIDLMRPPVQSVTSITYIDTAGDSQVLAGTEYQTKLTGSAIHTIKPAVDAAWPDTQAGAYDAVTVEYVAGYGLPSDDPQTIPTPIIQAILLMIGDMYENRETIIVGTSATSLPLTAELLLAPYRMMKI